MKTINLTSQSINVETGKSVKIEINGNSSVLLIHNRDDIEFYFNVFQELFEKHCLDSAQYHQCDCDWIDEVVEEGEYYKFNHNKNTTQVTYSNNGVYGMDVYFNQYTHQEVINFMFELTMKIGYHYDNIKWVFNPSKMNATFSISLSSEDIIYKNI